MIITSPTTFTSSVDTITRKGGIFKISALGRLEYISQQKPNIEATTYSGLIELAQLGTTIIDGGYIKTTLIDADYLLTDVLFVGDILEGEFLKTDLIDTSSLVTNMGLGALAYESVVEAAQLGTTLISGGYIRTDLIDADAILTDVLFVGDVSPNAPNLCKNSQFYNFPYKWTTVTESGATPCSYGLNLSADWTILGGNVLYAQQPDGNSTAATYIYTTDRIPAQAGKTYGASVYTGAHRCKVDIFIAFYDSADAAIAYSPFPADAINDQEASGGVSLTGYKRIRTLFTAPVGTTSMRLFIRKWGTVAGQTNSYMFATMAMLSEMAPGQTQFPAWGATADEGYDPAERINAMVTTIAGGKITPGTIEIAKLGTTLIDGGYIKTSLINADAILTNVLRVGQADLTAQNTALNTTNVGVYSAANVGYWASHPAEVINANVTTISGGKITTGSLAADKIVGNSITAGQLAAGAVTAINLGANSVVAGKVAANAIAAYNIIAGQIVTGHLAAGAITTGTINGNAVTEVASYFNGGKITTGYSFAAVGLAVNTVGNPVVITFNGFILSSSFGNLFPGTIQIRRNGAAIHTRTSIVDNGYKVDITFTDSPGWGVITYELWVIDGSQQDNSLYDFSFTIITAKR